jgi:hypothetical protein
MSDKPDLRLPYSVAVALVQVLRALPTVQVYEAMQQLQPIEAPPAAAPEPAAPEVPE